MFSIFSLSLVISYKNIKASTHRIFFKKALIAKFYLHFVEVFSSAPAPFLIFHISIPSGGFALMSSSIIFNNFNI